MNKLYLAFGIVALSLFSWAQVKGVGLFDDVIDPAFARTTGQRALFHK